MRIATKTSLKQIQIGGKKVRFDISCSTHKKSKQKSYQRNLFNFFFIPVQFSKAIGKTMMRIHQNRFLLDIPNVSGLQEICSRELYVHDIPWTVYVRKEEFGGEKWLGVYLRCANRDTSSKWTIVASPTFKLVPFTDSAMPIEVPLMPYVFDSRRMDQGIRMIRWYNLVDVNSGFMINDSIRLDVQIQMAERNDPSKSKLILEKIDRSCEEGGRRTKFRLTITNVEHLMAVRTPKFMLRNTLWHVIINKYPTNRLGIVLESMAKSKAFSCKVTVSAKLFNVYGPVEEIQTKEMKYLERLTVQMVPWYDLLQPENGFIQNNSIVIEMEINADTPNGIYATNRKRRATSNFTEAKLLKLECRNCMKSFAEQELSFIPCGHMFCSKCIEHSVRYMCPLCNGTASTERKRAYLPR